MYSMVTPVSTCRLSLRNTSVHSYCLYIMKKLYLLFGSYENCTYCLWWWKHQSVVNICVQNDNIKCLLSVYCVSVCTYCLVCFMFQCVLTVCAWQPSVYLLSVLCFSVYLLCFQCVLIVFQCVLTVCASCFSVSHSVLQGPASHRVHVWGAWHARCTRTKTPPHRLAAGKIHQRN